MEGDTEKHRELKEMKQAVMSAGKELFQGVMDLLYPPVCPVCGGVLGKMKQDSPAVCPECRKRLPYIGKVHCMKCGKELADEQEEYCGDCQRLKHCFDQSAAAFSYSEDIKQSVYRFKYQNKRTYADWYAQAVEQVCGGQIMRWAPQVIIPVPLHRSRQKKRGYNQAGLLADTLGKRMNIPVDTACLQRVERTRPMKQLGDEERIKNLENAFNITSNSVKYNKVLLVDDIYTTGATLDACARVLKEHGAGRVYAVCLCIGKGFI